MDIAKIGFSADTKDLDKATISLNKLKAAAAGTTSASKSVAEAATAVATAEASKARAYLASVKASGTATKVEIEAAKQALKTANAHEANTRAMLKQAIAADKLAKATRGVSNASAFNAAAAGQGRASPVATGIRIGSSADAPIARDQAPNRFNTANIAAQFQDIGVTASMGMNPLTIALQQGTQLSAILNSMESPLKGIAQAFRQILNPVALLSIGFVGLAAAAIQFTDWISVGQGLLNGMASAFDTVGENATGLTLIIGALGAFLIALNARAIASTIKSLYAMGAAAVATGVRMAHAWIVGLGPISLTIAAIGAVVGALIIFRDKIEDVFGIDIVQAAKTAVNKMIGLFVGAFKVIVEVWRNVGREIRGEATVALGDVFDEAMNKDYVGAAAAGITKAASKAADKIRALASGLGQSAGDVAGGMKKDPWEELTKGHDRRMAELKAEQAALGKSAQETSRLKYETELLNEAQQKNIKLTPDQTLAIQKMASEMSSLEAETKRAADTYDYLRDMGRSFVSDLKTSLMEGKNAWQSFTDAVSNLLNKLADKLLSSGTDLLFSTMFPANDNKKSGGGLLSSIGSILGFAKGGAFTNGIYSSPTMFQFASGGAFGVMGEAGPEAVMPLHRGPDGSLGVRMEGGGSGEVVVNINNYGNSTTSVQQRRTSQGMEIDVMIDEIVGEKLSQQGTNSNNSLKAFNNRKLTQR